VLHSGLMRLIYSASRALCATDRGHFSGEEPKSSLSAAEVAGKIAELFENYELTNTATVQRFAATDGQQAWANAIACHAEVFLLMHELAHVANEHVFWLWRPFRPARSILELERAADATAFGWLIDHVLHPERGGPPRQMFYAGAEFGLRVRMAMETTGLRFEQTHPAAGDRIAALRAQLRATSGSQAFYQIASTAIAADQMWRAIELMLLKQPPVFEFVLDDVLAAMRTLVVELLRGSSLNELIAGGPGADQPPVTLAPKDPLKIRMVESARCFLSEVRPETRAAARQHAADVYREGTVEFSLLSALLNTVCP
jgi:hypothetical protein